MPQMFMMFGYFAGCVIGIIAAAQADVKWMNDFAPDLVAKQRTGLFTVFCSCAVYGLGMMFLATSYLGFLFIPAIFSVKGFFSASVFTACIRSNFLSGLEQACVRLFLPGMFLLPAMLILGQRCMHWSVRLFRCRAGEMIPPDSTAPRTLGIVLFFILIASVMKAFVVPFVLDLL